MNWLEAQTSSINECHSTRGEDGEPRTLLASVSSRIRRDGVVVAAIVLGIILVSLPMRADAQGSLHEVSWAHGAPASVEHFVVFASPSKGDEVNARMIDVGKPSTSTVEPSGEIFQAIISIELDEFVAIAAIDVSGRMSPLSEWFAPPPTSPGRPYFVPPGQAKKRARQAESGR